MLKSKFQLSQLIGISLSDLKEITSGTNKSNKIRLGIKPSIELHNFIQKSYHSLKKYPDNDLIKFNGLDSEYKIRPIEQETGYPTSFTSQYVKYEGVLVKYENIKLEFYDADTKLDNFFGKYNNKVVAYKTNPED